MSDDIHFKFEKHHISNTPNRGQPASWAYLIREPDDSIGGLNLEVPAHQALIQQLTEAGFHIVPSAVYDEFLRSCRIQSHRMMSPEDHAAYIQTRYTFQRMRVLSGEITEGQLTWGEWEEYMPSSWGWYAPLIKPTL